MRFLLAVMVLAVGWSANILSAQDKAGRVVFLGDSLTAGYGLNVDDAYPALIQRKIEQAGLNYQVVNAGVSGDTSAGGLRRVDWLLKEPVAVLVLALGANDGLRGVSPEETEKNLIQIIEKVRAKDPATKVLIAGMKLPANFGVDYVGKFTALYPNVAKKENATLVPFLLEGVGGSVDLNQADRIHPNEAGQKILADTVWKYLEPVLKGK